MKKFKPIFTAVLALALLLAAMPAAVFAAEAPTETSLSVDDAFSSGRFVQMTREEYITGKASLLGISYSEAEAIVDKSIADAIAELPKEATSETGDNAISPQSWRSTDTETNLLFTDSLKITIHIHPFTKSFIVFRQLLSLRTTERHGPRLNRPGRLMHPGMGRMNLLGSAQAE